MRVRGGDVWRAARTPAGPVTVQLFRRDGDVVARAWGPGAVWALDAAPALAGEHDDDRGFSPRHPVVRELARRLVGVRLPRSGAVMQELVPTILEQKVTAIEARRAFTRMVGALSEPAPGPPGLLLPPAPERLAATPSWAFHPFGIERKRADTIRAASARAVRIEETTTMTPADAHRRLTAFPGVGEWTAAKVSLVAFGDPDAVPVGDFHLKHHVCFALAGLPRGDDDTMLELLEPWRGQRGRVARLLMMGGPTPPRYGPRLEPRAIAGI